MPCKVPACAIQMVIAPEPFHNRVRMATSQRCQGAFATGRSAAAVVMERSFPLWARPSYTGCGPALDDSCGQQKGTRPCRSKKTINRSLSLVGLLRGGSVQRHHRRNQGFDFADAVGFGRMAA